MAYTVSQLLFDVLPRIGDKPPSGITLLGAANSISSLIFKRLLKTRSDLLATGRLSAVIPADGFSLVLPTDFISLAEKPHAMEAADAVTTIQADLATAGLSAPNQALVAALFAPGTGVLVSAIQSIVTAQAVDVNVQTIIDTLVTSYPSRSMEPHYLDEDEHEDLGWWDWYGHSQAAGTKTPDTMKVIDDSMYLRPKCSGDVSIRGRYFQKPSTLTTTTDTLPFRSLFDEVYREGTVQVLMSGVATPDNDPVFMAFINREVDTVVNSRVHHVKSDRRIARRNWV